MRLSPLLLSVLIGAQHAVACSSSDPAAPPGDAPAPASSQVIPGVGLGEVRVGDTWAALRGKLGAATEVGLNGLVFGRFPDRGLEVVFASGNDDTLSDDAVVLAASVRAGVELSGAPRPGMTRAGLIAALGEPTDEIGQILYWASGASARLGDDGVALQVAVFAKYVPETAVAEMTASKGAIAAPRTIGAAAVAKVAAVDMHLHPGSYGRIPAATRKMIVSAIPPFTQIYAPGALAAALDPWAPFVGVRAQTRLAGVDHAVLFAVYTQRTTGWFSNEDLEAVLADPRNVTEGGLPWAFGLASIDFFDGFVRPDGTVDPAIAKSRLDALSSYFERRRDLFIGIKLAHPHQHVAFDDARFLGVYDVAAKHGVPVYLHTGFSPFEGAKNERAYYDPDGLRNTIENQPKVRFILGHVGQGDALAVEHALKLAADLPNVFLEISALNRPILRDEDGKDVAPDKDAPQYPWVLEQIKKRGLVDKTIFGTDGPQYAGMVRGYVALITKTMREKGFTDDEIAKVMSRNFFAVFFGTA
ncbi:MAG: amidohydrolase family protein [Deltaproteobacteria bacterium]|nr:amidohydrolase family protein [Deltaproteobacteria bacterium]